MPSSVSTSLTKMLVGYFSGGVRRESRHSPDICELHRTRHRPDQHRGCRSARRSARNADVSSLATGRTPDRDIRPTEGLLCLEDPSPRALLPRGERGEKARTEVHEVVQKSMKSFEYRTQLGWPGWSLAKPRGYQFRGGSSLSPP